MPEEVALVGIVPRQGLWSLIERERWYHIPVESAPGNALSVKRIKLFPGKPEHKRAGADYYQFHLGEIEKLPRPIPSSKLRRIIHIPTTRKKLLVAQEINDLWETSPLEEKMHWAFKKRNISAERQFYVNAGGQSYFLDFAVFCREGSLDVECDGERYHVLPQALARDRKRNNRLTSYGWSVLRFGGREINQELPACLREVAQTITTLGGAAG